VIIECSHCHAKYQYDESRFEGKTSKRIRCAKCQQVFEILNPASAAPAQVGAAAAKAGEKLEQTLTARPRTLDVPKPAADVPPTTGRQDLAPQLPAGYRLSLAVISGPDAGSVHRIDKPRVRIGRAADISLNDSEASRHHAALEIHDQVYVLEDLGSTNGTLIEGEKISGRVELHNQSEFQVGSSTLMLIVTEEG
jgi:predicted Zn finger-like uncharacterized protein